MFLSLESLLNSISCRMEREGEEIWFRKALTKVNNEYSFSFLAPEDYEKGPVDFVFTSQYKGIRCKIFHSKDDIILPHEALNPTDVSRGFKLIFRLWKHITSNYFMLPNNCGSDTYQYYNDALDWSFSNGLTFLATSDSTQSENDEVISPANYPIFTFDENMYMGVIEQGRAMLSGALTKNTLEKINLIHRIGTTINNVPCSIIHFTDGIVPVVIDRFEINETVRLMNGDYPKFAY